MNKNKSLFVAIWFFNLSIDLILIENPKLKGKPLCVLRKYGQREIIIKINSKGKSLGLIEGTKPSDAMIIAPGLIVKKDLPLRRKKFYLDKIIFWLTNFTPKISIAKDATLILDISNTAKNPYIESKIVRKIESSLRNSNITTKVAVADTVGAAWAKSHFIGDEIVTPTKQDTFSNSTMESIAKLPIKTLRISSASATKLNSIGIETIDQLKTISRNELSLRFNNEVSSFFDKATGKEREPLPIIKIESKFQMKIDLVEYPSCKYQVMALTKKLVITLCTKLKRSHVNAQTVNIIFNSEKKIQKIIKVSLATPTNSHNSIISIFAAKFFRLKNIPEIHNIKVAIPKTYPVLYEQKRLPDSDTLKEKKYIPVKMDNKDIFQLVEKLGNRLGEESVRIFSPRENHIPEKSYIFKSPIPNMEASNWPILKKKRPKILFEPQPIIMLKQISKSGSDKQPSLFYWGGQKYEVSKAIGPERISSNWWLGEGNHENAERDYWQVKSTCGFHLWLFHSKKKFGENYHKDKWLIQGQFC